MGWFLAPDRDFAQELGLVDTQRQGPEVHAVDVEFRPLQITRRQIEVQDAQFLAPSAAL